MVTEPTKVGLAVTCTRCGNRKQPHGRSAPLDSWYCDYECVGFYADPKPGCLWPGENDAEFGYDSCDHATRPMTAEEIAKWKEKEVQRGA